MRILILSWRDIKNPLAGGAEIATHEYLKRLSKNGHDCTCFSAEFQNSKKFEHIDGYKVVRKGRNFVSVILNAFLYCRRNNFDVIIDQVTLLPFFTPFYSKSNSIAFIHDVGREFWFYELPFPLSVIGYLAEKVYLRFYKNMKTVTVSNSTKRELEKLGFKKIHIIPCGVSFKALKKMNFSKKEKNLTICFGRVAKSKRIDHVIRAVSIVKKDIREIKLVVCGRVKDAEYLQSLKELVKKNNLDENVCFYENASSKEIKRLLTKSAVEIIASVQEGWGLVVIEANCFGTPAVGYDVRGLRDSIVDGKTGILVKENGNVEKLAEAVIKILKDERLRKRLSKNAMRWARRFSWDKSAEEFERVIKSVVE
jgi:glycosyltransferase involved in cell wall biosynthesis